MDYENIKRSVSIREVLNKYGIIHPERDHYRISCPIHGGVDKNFVVTESKGLWFCFSNCGKGGTVIDLVASLDKCTAREAATKLTETWNIQEPNRLVMKASQTMRDYGRFKSLKTDNPVSDIMMETSPLEAGYRGLSEDTINHFKLARTKQGVYIPWFTDSGEQSGYSIRQPEGRLPKYLNSHGSLRRDVFGLFLNREAISRLGSVVLVEGQFDCMSLYNRGTQNVAALMGCTLTDAQAHSLMAITTKLTLLLDGDKAGRDGARKIQETWGRTFTIRTIDLPDGEDPDTYKGELEI